MKKLTFKHAMKAAKIIKTAQLKESLTEIIEEANKNSVNKMRVGIQGVMAVVDACASEGVDQQLYELLDDIFETKSEEMSLDALVENCKQLAKENNVITFFKSAGALAK